MPTWHPASNLVVEVAPKSTATEPLDLVGAASLPVEEVLTRLAVTTSGLGTSEAEERLRTYGPNVLLTHKVTAFGVLMRQVRNPLLILLCRRRPCRR